MVPAVAQSRGSGLIHPLVPMATAAEKNKRIARNTVMLYIRALFVFAVTLYISRIVLNILGVEDYGIYNIVGGVVALIGFLNASMSGATSRFLTYELGRNDSMRLRDTFSSALIIHIGIAVFLLLIAETVGFWFLNCKLDIPQERMNAANWLYQFAIAVAILKIVQVPYNASIIAHEKMDVYAYIEIFNVVMRLGAAYLLLIGIWDKLAFYALLDFCVAFIVLLLYRGYCVGRFEECRFRWVWDKRILYPILCFSGWDLYGNASVTVRTQGVSVLLNMFIGPIANAAAGIANQVQVGIGLFANNIVTAFKPQIIKSYSCGELDVMSTLIYNAAKYTYLLLLCFSLPLMFEMNFVLTVWLRQVPEYTVVFCIMTLIFNFGATWSLVFAVGIHATGKIKRISLINGTLYFSVIPIAYIAFRLGSWVAFPFLCNAVFVFIGCLSNVYTLGLYTHVVSLKDFARKVVCPCLGITLLSCGCIWGIRSCLTEGWGRLFVVGAVSFAVIASTSYAFILSPSDRTLLKRFVMSKLCHH